MWSVEKWREKIWSLLAAYWFEVYLYFKNLSRYSITCTTHSWAGFSFSYWKIRYKIRNICISFQVNKNVFFVHFAGICCVKWFINKIVVAFVFFVPFLCSIRIRIRNEYNSSYMPWIMCIEFGFCSSLFEVISKTVEKLIKKRTYEMHTQACTLARIIFKLFVLYLMIFSS